MFNIKTIALALGIVALMGLTDALMVGQVSANTYMTCPNEYDIFNGDLELSEDCTIPKGKHVGGNIKMTER